MKTATFNFFSVIVMCGLTFQSCSKYEYGPEFTVLTKKQRVTNSWEVDRAYDDGDDVTSSYDEYDLILNRDQSATLTATYGGSDTQVIFATNGTWEFLDQGGQLYLDMEDDDADQTYFILRLTEDELWLREKGDDLELHLIPSK